MRSATILLLVLTCGMAWAESQPPTPAPAKSIQKNERHFNEKEQPATQAQRGTENEPFFVKVVPSTPVEPRTNEHTEQANDYSSPEWWLVYVTVVLAGITAILACYTAKLWGATKTLAEDAEITAKQQAADMQSSLRIAKESADTARDEFISTHRPRVIVRRIAHNRMGRQSPLHIQVILTNIGSSEATIRHIAARLVEIDGPLRAIPPYGTVQTVMIPLKPGYGHELPVRVDVTNEEFDLQDGYGTATTSMYCLGVIVYEDALQRSYWTAFARRYNASTKRFDRIDDPDYEYQD